MKPLLRTLTLALLAGWLVAGSAGPARAAVLEFPDDPGDATGFVVESTPAPNEPKLDLLLVNYTSTADSVLFTARTEEFGIPDASQGSTFRWHFTYEGIAYNVALQMPGNGGENYLASGPVFWKGATNLGCGRCSVKNDAKANTVGVIVPFRSMSSAMKSEDPDQPNVGHGSKFEGLRATSQRAVGLITATTDTAAPADGTTFVL